MKSIDTGPGWFDTSKGISLRQGKQSSKKIWLWNKRRSNIRWKWSMKSIDEGSVSFRASKEISQGKESYHWKISDCEIKGDQIDSENRGNRRIRLPTHSTLHNFHVFIVSSWVFRTSFRNIQGLLLSELNGVSISLHFSHHHLVFPTTWGNYRSKLMEYQLITFLSRGKSWYLLWLNRKKEIATQLQYG
jgi:hypothetical protein